MKKTIFIALYLLITSAFAAESVWCRKFNLGCQTPAEEKQKYLNCKMLSDQIYQDALAAALSDSTVWGYNGNRSAQDYAEWRKNFMYSRCMQNT